MIVKDLKKILLRYKDTDNVTISKDYIKVAGKFNNGDDYEEFINSAGGIWEGGIGYAPNGKWCGECSTFDCDKCGWEERK